MKILYITTKSEAGGAQTQIYQLSKYFIAKSDDVAVMSYPGGWLEDEIKKIGGKFYANIFFSNSPNPVSIFRAAQEIKKAIRDLNPDLIHCHSSAAGFITRLTVRNRIPTIFTAHGWGFASGAPFPRRCAAVIAEKIASHYAKKIICVSNQDRELALRYHIVSPEKLVVIYNGVEIFHTPYAIRHTLPLHIISVGRLTEPKDPLLLIKAFEMIPDHLKQKSEISIIGDGPQKKELAGYIQRHNLGQKVKLLGTIPRENIFDLLGQADIFALISKWEGFPMTILEAMAAGLPVIASDVGGIKEAVDEASGILAPRNGIEKITKALEILISNQDLRIKMGTAAKTRVLNLFSLEKMLVQTENVYKNICAGPGCITPDTYWTP